jgi:peroxiredoxin
MAEGARKGRKRQTETKGARDVDPNRAMLASGAQLAFVAAAAVLVYSFVSVAREGETRRVCAPVCLVKADYAGASRRAPDFTLTDTKGQKVSLSSFRGKVVVLNFWTKTCGPCLEEMPDLAELARVLKPRGDALMLTVSIDESAEDATQTLRSVLREEPPFPVLIDSESAVVKGKFGTSLFPETWIIDKRGVIRARFDGPRDWTSPAIVELVDQLRAGAYCPVEINAGSPSGEAAKVCESLTGG